MSPKQKFQKAKTLLLLDEVFFGFLLLNLKSVESDQYPTMCTDSVTLWWNPKFVESLTLQEVKTVLAHEVLHCALAHCLRRGNRDSGLWNQACDYAVNSQLTEYSKSKSPEPFTFPKGVLLDPQYDGLSVEAIYSRLPQPMPQPQNQQGQQGTGSSQGSQPQDQPGMGEVTDYPDAKDESKAQEQEARWKTAMTQSAAIAKGQGKLPAGIARMVEEILNPKADWKERLRRFAREYCKDDYSWSRPNPRYLSSGFILPSLHSQRLGEIAVAVDTSGSIDAELLNVFLGEIESICHECRPSKIRLIDCDADVNSVREFEPTEPLPRDFKGGGGTDFRPVFDLLDEEPPAALIYFTDLCGSFPESESSYPVLWATKGDSEAPFGETIHLE